MIKLMHATKGPLATVLNDAEAMLMAERAVLSARDAGDGMAVADMSLHHQDGRIEKLVCVDDPDILDKATRIGVGHLVVPDGRSVGVWMTTETTRQRLANAHT